MNAGDARLDARLRRHFAGIDTAADFEAGVAARVAASRLRAASDLRAQYERRRERLRRRLRRELWTNGATIAGIGTAAGAILWRYAPDVLAWPSRVNSAADLEILVGIGLAAIVLGLWPQLQRFVARL